jgi:hypothetical protein
MGSYCDQFLASGNISLLFYYIVSLLFSFLDFYFSKEPWAPSQSMEWTFIMGLTSISIKRWAQFGLGHTRPFPVAFLAEMIAFIPIMIINNLESCRH